MEEQQIKTNFCIAKHPNHWQSLLDQPTLEKSCSIQFVLKGGAKVTAPRLLVFLAVPELANLLGKENFGHETLILIPDIEKEIFEENLDALYNTINSSALQNLIFPKNGHGQMNDEASILLNVKAENIKIENDHLEVEIDNDFSELSSDVIDYDYIGSSQSSSPIPDPIAVELGEGFEHPFELNETLNYENDNIDNIRKTNYDQTMRHKTVNKNNLTRSIDEYVVEDVGNKETRKGTAQVLNLYSDVMKVAAEELGQEYIPLTNVKLEDLPDNLCRFFMICRKKNGQEFNASSIQTFYQSIARFMSSHHKVDIKHDQRFKKVKDIVKARSSELAKNGGVPGINASKAVNTDHIRLAFDKGTLGRHNPRALISTVHYCLLSGFGCRSSKEIRDITNGDILFGPEDESRLPKYLELSERITKSRHGSKYKEGGDGEKVYLDNDYPDLCPVRTLLEYQQRKNPEQREQHHPLLLSIKPAAEKNPFEEPFWFINAPMGVNTISKLFTKACEDAGIDVKAEKISATSCRKQVVQARSDSFVPGRLLSKIIGQKSLESKPHDFNVGKKSTDTFPTKANISIAPKPILYQQQMNIPGPSHTYQQFPTQPLLVPPQQIYLAPGQILKATKEETGATQNGI